jgi:hypothetical protein
MAPYEYRLCAEPHSEFQHSWTVTLWTRHYSSDPDSTQWVCRVRAVVRGEDWPHDPRKCWPLILGKLKV